MTIAHELMVAPNERWGAAILDTIDTEYAGMASMTASYLRVQDGEAAFIETSAAPTVPRMLAALAQSKVAPEQVRWVIVTHAHLDHAGGASSLMKALPRATLLAHPRAARHLIDPTRLVASASQVYGEQLFQQLYGEIEPIAADRVQTMADGARAPLGKSQLQFFHTRGHANHHFIVADEAIEGVFTGDTFGLVYPTMQHRGLLAFPSTSPTDFDAAEARASIDRVLSLGFEMFFPTHFGPVRNPHAVATQLRRWLDLSEELVNEAVAAGNPPDTEERIKRRLSTEMDRVTDSLGLEADRRTLLDLDLGLNAQGLAFAARHKVARAAQK